LKPVVLDFNQFMLCLALNYVKEKDKNSILVHIFKHSKLSQKTQQKHAWKFGGHTNLWLCEYVNILIQAALAIRGLGIHGFDYSQTQKLWITREICHFGAKLA